MLLLERLQAKQSKEGSNRAVEIVSDKIDLARKHDSHVRGDSVGTVMSGERHDMTRATLKETV